jgi:hypothetical protein
MNAETMIDASAQPFATKLTRLAAPSLSNMSKLPAATDNKHPTRFMRPVRRASSAEFHSWKKGSNPL